MGEDGQDEVLDSELDEGNDGADDEPQDGAGEGEEGAEGSEGADGGDTAGEDEDVVQIGDEEPPASEETKAAAPWVKDLRRRYRELAAENQRLKANQPGQPAGQPQKLRDKPTLEGHEFDAEAFQADLDKWYGEKRESETHEARQREANDARQKAVQAVHENYANSKKALKVKDFQDAEDEVVAALDQVQQSIVMAGTKNPGAMVYALGRNPKRLQELASIKDPVKFAVAVGDLQRDVKVTKRTSTKPAPEKTVRGNGTSGASKATLERLEAEADRTGDRTKVAAYRRQLKQGQK